MFISGQAGTGKSYLLCNLYRRLKALGNTDNGGRRWSAVALTATTGIAAINIGGITLHSWAGIPLQPFVEDTMVINNSGDLNEMDHSVRVVANYLQMPRNRAALWRWLNTRTLIIDECSLIHPESLDFIDQLARHLRNTTSGGHCRQSFGGMQLILCGDFMQLPPVIRQSERHRQAMMLAEQRRLMRDKFVQSRQYQLGEQQLMACNDALVGSAFQFDQVQLTADDQMLLDEQLMQWEAKQQSINGSSAAAVSHRFCFDAKVISPNLPDEIN
jgi:ATP-dependent DNA helicase PIF1